VAHLQLASGERANVAFLPFVSQRGIVRVDQLMSGSAAEFATTYAQRVESIVAALARDGFDAGSVNMVVAHHAVVGGGTSGSERAAQTIFDYYVPASAFPASAHYVALGHFHNPQQVPAPGRVWYSGSPLQLDFGEEGYQKQVLIIDAAAGLPATVRGVDLRCGVPLRTVTGDEAYVVEAGRALGEAHLRVVVEGQRRAGLADDIREQLPNAVEVQMADGERAEPQVAPLVERPAHELFAEYLSERGAHDERVVRLFVELLEEANAT
jgi:exonuclease SbcD